MTSVKVGGILEKTSDPSLGTGTFRKKTQQSPPTKRRKRPAKPLKITAHSKKAKKITAEDDDSVSSSKTKQTRKLTTTAIVARNTISTTDVSNVAAIDVSENSTQSTLRQFCSKFRAKPPHRETTTDKANSSKTTGREQQDRAEMNQNENSEQAPSAGPVVQIINGEIVLQESSMVLHGNSKPPTEEDEEYQVVEEEDQLGGIGSSYTSFSKRWRRPKHWNVNETQLFYEALRQVGTDFVTMESFFSSSTKRTRKMLKDKYKKDVSKMSI